MRVLMRVSIPVAQGNEAIKNGSLPQIIGKFMEAHKPEAAFFVSDRGLRTAYFGVDLPSTIDLPSFAEPFFMGLGATVEIMPAMNPADMQAGVKKAMDAQ